MLPVQLTLELTTPTARATVSSHLSIAANSRCHQYGDIAPSMRLVIIAISTCGAINNERRASTSSRTSPSAPTIPSLWLFSTKLRGLHLAPPVLRRGVAMTRAVAIGQVVQGDKEKPELTDMINTTCAVDLAELEGDEATGADVCQEYKVVAPLTKSRRMGRGSVLHGGTVADVGHLYAFGNTEERYRIKILGCKGKGTLGVDRPFNHTTKVGSVKERTGDYEDALRNKKEGPGVW